MLKSFQIKNFRLFQHLEIRKLSRVNLIVGRNNAGKSTFLEAVELYASNASSPVLLDLLEARQESWVSDAQPIPQGFLENPLRHLFFGHKLPELGGQGIAVGEIPPENYLHITLAAYQNQYDSEEGVLRRIRINNEDYDEDLSDIEVLLVAEEGEKTKRIFRLDRDVRELRRNSRVSYERKESDFKYRCQTVPTEKIQNRKLAPLWDLTGLTNLESEVIHALKLIEPKVSGVAFVEDVSKGRSPDSRIPLVKIEDVDEPLPLKSMGDGITRLFNITVTLVNAQNGLLLIDEFENGLHWSVQPKIWDIVFKLAERLNVQVFATTHSRDCIEGFDSAWNKNPSLGTLFRLDMKDGHVKSTEYTSETLTDAIDMDVEVR